MRWFAVCGWLAIAPIHAGEPAPKRVDDALALLRSLSAKDNAYVFGGNVVVFDKSPECKTDCSGLLNALLKHADGFDAERMRRVLGSTRPTAKRYFDAIADRKDFDQVENIRSGDILAIAYVKNYTGRATGHVMLAAGRAQHMEPRGPLISGTTQWEVPVIDSAINGHGPDDTRRPGTDGKKSTGIGK